MKRREFLKSGVALAAAQSFALPLMAGNARAEEKKDETQPSAPLIDSEPMLQNYAETSMGVAFSVTANANGYVIYGEKPDLSDGKKVYCGGYRVTDMNPDAMLVRLTGLKSATTYYYKIGADRIHYGGGYDMKIIGNEEGKRVYSFRTAGTAAKSHFSVINDTHVNWPAFEKLTNKLSELAPACVVWNGDASNVEETIEDQKIIFLKPRITRKDYAAETPYLFCPGNHDLRGLANRHLERVWMYRQPEERSSRDWDLGRNFAVRVGDLALIGLDTGEDKLDTNPIFANLFASVPYRQAQVAWLKDALRRKEIASAPYLVACCHIPLYDENPNANPGDVAPADVDPRYTWDYADWQRPCYLLWSPLLEEAGCQLVITAHQHVYRFDAPTKDHSWAQIVGGGPVGNDPESKEFATLIDGEVKDGNLVMRVHNIAKGVLVEEHSFKPRKVKPLRK